MLPRLEEAWRMVGLLKFLFFMFVAVVVGVFIGTVPLGGKTLAERIGAGWSTAPSASESPAHKVAGAPKTAARTAPHSKAPIAVAVLSSPAPTAAPAIRAKLVTAGAANTPDRHSDEEQAALEAVIAQRTQHH
jgi:hypothetical protein